MEDRREVQLEPRPHTFQPPLHGSTLPNTLQPVTFKGLFAAPHLYIMHAATLGFQLRLGDAPQPEHGRLRARVRRTAGPRTLVYPARRAQSQVQRAASGGKFSGM